MAPESSSKPNSAHMTIQIDGRYFKDAHGRIITLRGVNLGSDAKNPTSPHIPSHISKGLFDADHVSFVGAPFPLADADEHLGRIKGYGFNIVRFIFSWEALEHAGPGKYDEEYIDYVIEVLRKCRQHGLLVFMDPHQDVWSRFSGGSGAPMWTLTAAGLNPENFHITEGAILHSQWPEPDKFPFMLWSSNYHRLVCYTMFTLFFSGRDFAPRAIINDMNIQDFLQNCFISAIKHFAARIHAAGDLENATIIGWESFNEPHYGFTGNLDLNKLMPNQQIRLGTVPTPFQTMALGSGLAETVDYFEFGSFGPAKKGTRHIDPEGVKVWASPGVNEVKYGWKRSPDWKLGECIWAQHGVWNSSTGKLLEPNYFAKTPDGEEITDEVWMQRYFLPHVKSYIDAIRESHKEAMILLQPPVWFIPPKLNPESLGGGVVYSPHFYDGLTLMQKKWKWWNVDGLGYLRGKYLTPMQALRLGATAIRNCFREQLKTMKEEGLNQIGDTPCLMSEIGIPYDMDNKKAYKDGKYGRQYAAMDANNFALEGAGLNYTLWCYCSNNSHQWGDLWDGEDLSVWSKDDESPHPPTPFDKEKIDGRDRSPQDPYLPRQSIHDARHGDEPIPSDLVFSFPHQTRLENGSRAMEAFVRPSPIATAGTPISYIFDLANCSFQLKFQPTHETEDKPTEIFIPDYFFRGGAEPEIAVSSGRWMMFRQVQVLRWWHEGSDEQSLKISSGYRHTGMAESVDDSGYYLGIWIARAIEKCIVM